MGDPIVVQELQTLNNIASGMRPQNLEMTFTSKSWRKHSTVSPTVQNGGKLYARRSGMTITTLSSSSGTGRIS